MRVYDKDKHDELVQEEARLAEAVAEISTKLNDSYASDDAWDDAKTNAYMVDQQRHGQLTREHATVKGQLDVMEGLKPADKGPGVNESPFARYIQKGKQGLSDEEREGFMTINEMGNEVFRMSLATRSDDASGQAGTEETTRHAMVDRLLAYGGVAKACMKFNSPTGSDYNMPQIDTASQEGEVLDAQNTPIDNENLPNIGEVVWTSRTYSSKSIQITREMLQDNVVDIENYTRRAIVRRHGRIANKAATLGLGNGNANGGAGSAGANRSIGVIPSAKAGLTAAAADALTYPELSDMEFTVDLGYLEDEQGEGAFSPEQNEGMIGFMMSRDCERVIRRTVDGDGRPLWVPSMRDGTPARINNWPYVLNFNMDNVATGKVPLLFGNFGYYGMRMVQEIEIFRFFDSRTAQNNRIEFVSFMRRDARPIGAVVGGKCEAYAKLTMA